MISRIPKIEKFTQIQNDIVERNDISGLAKAILWYCLTKPDSWNFYMGDISNHFQSDSKYSIEKAIKELENKGFIIRKKIKTATKFIWEWNIYEQPEAIINSEKSSNDENIAIGENQISGFPDCLDAANIVILTSSNTKKDDIKDNSPTGADAPLGLGAGTLIGKSVIELYFSVFEERFGEPHVKVSKVRLNAISKLLSDISRDIGVDLDMWEHMIRFYMFVSKFKIDVDYNINHFTSNGMLSVYLEREFGKPVLSPKYIA